nr:MAG TPA: hypothetical protein [Caudoviricetes sp.]
MRIDRGCGRLHQRDPLTPLPPLPTMGRGFSSIKKGYIHERNRPH